MFLTVDELVERYDGLIFDAFGVLINSSGALPGAARLIDRLNDIKKPYVIVTNDSSRLPATTAGWYHENGLNIDVARILTSGRLLIPYFKKRGLQGARCIVLGTPDSAAYVELAGGEVINIAPDADLDVLVIGDDEGYPFLPSIEAVLSAIIARLDQGHPVELIAPNPDLFYPKAQGRYAVASGGIALLIESVLRERYPARTDIQFVHLGKPHPAVFEEGAQLLGTGNIAMVGDQLRTDIRGANDFGIDSVLIGTGLTKLTDSNDFELIRPTYLLRDLV